jgi:hypothetical protein
MNCRELILNPFSRRGFFNLQSGCVFHIAVLISKPHLCTDGAGHSQQWPDNYKKRAITLIRDKQKTNSTG